MLQVCTAFVFFLPQFHKLELNATTFDLMAIAFFTMQKNATVFFSPRRPTLGGNATFWHNFCYIATLGIKYRSI